MISHAKLPIRRRRIALGGLLVIALALITIGFGVSRGSRPATAPSTQTTGPVHPAQH